MLPVFYITNLIYLLLSSNIWLQFSMPVTIELVGVNLILFITSFKYIKHSETDYRFPLIVFLLLLAWNLLNYKLIVAINNTLLYTPALILYRLPKSIQKKTLSFITKWLGIIIIFGFFQFILTMLIDVPPLLGTFIANDSYAPFKNHLFFLESTYQMGTTGLYRFNGIFLEPGHLAIISAIMIFANNYDFKKVKFLWIYLFSIIISFSLAGYVICLLGYIGLRFKNLKYILVGSLSLLMSYYFVTQVWNDGDNVVNELIVSRLEYDEEKGITGNNRTFKMTDTFFEFVITTDEFWKGVDMEYYEDIIHGSGYKIYILQYGIISTVLVLLFYISLISPMTDKRYAITFAIIIILIFLQRAYPFWYSWLLPFTLGCGININNIRSRNSITSNLQLIKCQADNTPRC